MSTMVSIVVPTRNEAADIGATLNAIASLTYPRIEALVVDASDDRTAEVVRAHASARIRLLTQSRGRGRAAARNEGILAARGDIVIVLNADVRLPPDFVERILAHYQAGADYVLVESRVSNVHSAFGRYVQALHERQYPARPDVETTMHWTEGFSCRRDAAIAVGLFPEGTDAPLVAGEDGWFGEKLHAAGYRKVFDRTIVVSHVAPDSLHGFWEQRVGRGRGWPQVLRERYGWSRARVIGLALRVGAWRTLWLLVPMPSLWRGATLSAHSRRGRADWPSLAALSWIDSLATIVGLATGAARSRTARR